MSSILELPGNNDGASVGGIGITEPLIYSMVVRALVAAVRARGADADALIARHGLPANVEQLPDLVLPLPALRAVADDAATVLGDTFLGLHLSLATQRGQLGMFEFILRSAPTVRDAMRCGARYNALVTGLTQLSIEERGGEALFDERLPGQPGCLGTQCNEYFIAMAVRFLRDVTRSEWRPRRVWLAHERTGDVAPLVAFFGTDRIAFGAGSNGFAFDARDLDCPMPAADRALHGVLAAQAQRIVAERPVVASESDRIRERVRVALRDGAPRIEQVAAEVGMSTRSLQRRLAEQGTSFVALVDEVRAGLAVVYLGDAKLALGEVGLRLGYSDARAFLRAFKRWTGRTPGNYREAQRAREASR